MGQSGVVEAMSNEPPEHSLEPRASQGNPEEGEEVRPPLPSLLFLVLFPFLAVVALALLEGWIRRGGP